ncbi:hypothetical protein EXIGLDRAFT_773127 [Exidia glandulosa HHB12029]|uniref:Protein CPL1-like domain-containing protein n=1 Tax=Exidia glandulosa HHB12029 TaxID=1314781 RepID=A0A165EYR6_EXIGL|nr:hypothetical protein EXIGLDRAFT_773127 [Exidia glandulosa HHB12029]
MSRILGLTLTLVYIFLLSPFAVLAGSTGQHDTHGSLAELSKALASPDEASAGWGTLAARVRRRQQEALEEKFAQDPSAFLCPPRSVACPLAGDTLPPPRFDAWTKTGYECVDPLQELGNCGGCARTGNGTNCASVHGAYGATCVNGACVVRQCKSGYTFDFEGHCVRPSGYTRRDPIPAIRPVE